MMDDEVAREVGIGADAGRRAVPVPGSRFPVSSLFRFIDTPPAPGAWNMAVDEVLAASVAAGGAPTLRVYRWQPRCLSLGRNQPAAGHYDLDAIRARGIDVVRRPTGGRAVLHHRELTYSVAVRAGVLGSARETYHAINRALVAGLRRLGVAAALQPRGGRRAAPPSLAPCFAEPAEGEVVVDGRKLVGSAQMRERDVLLQHGSLPLGPGLEELRELLLEPADHKQDDAGHVTLAECRGVPTGWAELTAALRAGWAGALGADLRDAALTPAEADAAARLAARYSDVAWTFRC